MPFKSTSPRKPRVKTGKTGLSGRAGLLAAIFAALSATLLVVPSAALSSQGQDKADHQADSGQTRTHENVEEVIVIGIGDMDSLLEGTAQSVFGFDRSMLETPRSASAVSADMLEHFNVRDIDELIALAPSSFTQSFFGVAGSLDVRGTAGDTYFRGVRRLDNPGNYPLPLGAAKRMDVVRGPASPIYGPAKMGGYLNYLPKSARVDETGQIMAEQKGNMSLTVGDWDKAILSAEVGGPGRLGGRQFGYYIHGEIEDSGSYYDKSDVEQNLLQMAFDLDVSQQTWLEFGGMWHAYKGNQIAGWNRLTQDLIDHGTYTTGEPQGPTDTDGDGRISHQEFDTDNNGFTNYNPFLGLDDSDNPFVPGSTMTLAELETRLGMNAGDLSHLQLSNPGTATIDGSDALVAPEDAHDTDVLTLYFDIIHDTDSGWMWKNQLFYESYDTTSESAFGFSQFHDTWVVENKLVAAKTFSLGSVTAAVQISPSFRHTDFSHGDDYTNEYFDRRDLTKPSSALNKRRLATQIDDDYTEYHTGEYSNWGLALLGDFVWNNGLNILAGIRHDYIDMESRQPIDKLLFASSNNFCLPPGDCATTKADDTVQGLSWTLSLSYKTEVGLVPYITASEQSTLIAGQGAEVTVRNILNDDAYDTSELIEIGLKGSLLNNDLYFSASLYEQERTDSAAQSVTSNQTTITEGFELEVRWAATENLLLVFGYSHIEIVNLNTKENGYRFSFIGCDDLPNIPCHALYGGGLSGNVSAAPSGSRRAGMPENVYSLTGIYSLGNGWSLNGSIVDVEETPSGFSNSVMLPIYTLVNLGVTWKRGDWSLSVSGKNLTDEEYFRANFPNLFGSSIVLPELPRHFNAQLQYSY